MKNFLCNMSLNGLFFLYPDTEKYQSLFHSFFHMVEVFKASLLLNCWNIYFTIKVVLPLLQLCYINFWKANLKPKLKQTILNGNNKCNFSHMLYFPEHLPRTFYIYNLQRQSSRASLWKKVFSKISQKSQRNTCRSLFFNACLF